MSSCGSASCLGGALMQIVATGLADAVLTGNPNITFWRIQTKAYTNFALEVNIQDFNAGVPHFGQCPKINIDRVGDLVYFLYVIADLPGIGLPFPNPQTTPNAESYSILSNYDVSMNTPVEPYWTQDVGHALIDKAVVYIGGQCIDEIHSEFLYLWEELSGQPGKRLVEMTGNYQSVSALMIASRQPRKLYIPLPFWFTLNSGNALPLVSLQFHSFQVAIALKHYLKLLKLTYTAMNTYGYTLNQIEERPYFNPSNAKDVQPVSALSKLTNASLNAQMLITYIYLDQRERSQFADGQFETLINQHQRQDTSVQHSVSGENQYAGQYVTTQLELTFNHPVFEIYWVGRLGIHEDFNSISIPEYNEWFNFRGPLDTVTKLPIDIFQESQLKLNNSNRWPWIECRYFRLVEPYQFHTNICDVNMIYSYSFSLQPEDVQPAGSCNFSRIDNAVQYWKIDKRVFVGPARAGGPDVDCDQGYGAGCGTNPSVNSSLTIMIFVQNYNIMRFKYGLGGLRFAA